MTKLPTTVLGIDPGFSGALGLLYADGSFISSAPMPLKTDSLVFTKETRAEIDTASLAYIIRKWNPTIAIVEKVDASPNMGVSSAFRFGQGYGQIQGVLAASGVTVRNAYPAVWKSSLGLTSNKSLSREKASQLWPAQAHQFKKVKDADLAEALLLAYYGLRFITVK